MNPIFCLKILNIFKKFIHSSWEIPILIYHSIGSNCVENQPLPLGLFKRHLDFFKENKYNVISLYKLIEMIRERKKVITPTVSLTFDDGYEDSFSVAYPMLKEYGFPAAIFVIVNKVGQKGYLNFDQINKMVTEGLITVGSHTMNHNHLLHLKEENIVYEIEESKNILENNLGCRIDFFAYPWGGFSPCIQTMLKNAGYKAAFTTNMRINKNPSQETSYAIKRMTVARGDSSLRFLVKVSGLGYCFSRQN